MVASSEFDPAVRAALADCRPGASARSIPPAAYTDPGVYDVEVQQVFRRGWVGIGRADRWGNPGEYQPMEIGGVPLLVVRDEQGVLRALSNVCRHRGAVVADGSGCAARFTCPFHGWTYADDGRLIGAPTMRRTEGFDPADFSLPTFPTTEWAGFAFVSLDPQVEPFEEWIGDADDVHRPWPLAELRTGRRREFTVDCNWKAFAEVFNEYYHLPYVHPTSIDGLYGEPDPRDELEGAFTTQFGATSGTGALLESQQDSALPPMPGLVGREASGVRYTWLYPNMVVAIGHDCLWMYEVYPEGPDRTRCVQTVAFPEETMAAPQFAEVVKMYYERMDLANTPASDPHSPAPAPSATSNPRWPPSPTGTPIAC